MAKIKVIIDVPNETCEGRQFYNYNCRKEYENDN